MHTTMSTVLQGNGKAKAETPGEQRATPGTGAEHPKKRARRATGPLRKWLSEEDALLQKLVEERSSVVPPKSKDFAAIAVQLNDWASNASIPGSARTGYAVEQRWKLYLKPGAPKAAAASMSSVRQKSNTAETEQAAEPEAKGVFMHYCNHVDSLKRAECIGVMRDGNAKTGYGDMDWHFLFSCPRCKVDLEAVVPDITGGGVNGNIYADGHVLEDTSKGSDTPPCLDIERCRGHPDHPAALPQEPVECGGPCHGVSVVRCGKCEDVFAVPHSPWTKCDHGKNKAGTSEPKVTTFDCHCPGCHAIDDDNGDGDDGGSMCSEEREQYEWLERCEDEGLCYECTAPHRGCFEIYWVPMGEDGDGQADAPFCYDCYDQVRSKRRRGLGMRY